MSKKFYAVKVGYKTGVFDNWEDAKKQVDGYKGAIYQSFSNPKSAWDFIRHDQLKKPNIQNKAFGIEQLVSAVAYTDGSFDIQTNTYSYGVVILWKDMEVKISKRFNNSQDAELRNVAGEIEGAKKAMLFAQKNKIQYLEIHHDYQGISKWANDEWKANLPFTQDYKKFVSDIKRTVNLSFIWVKGHSGDYYNEMVDKLANDATFEEFREVNK